MLEHRLTGARPRLSVERWLLALRHPGAPVHLGPRLLGGALVLTLILFLLLAPLRAHAQELTVFAAASLTDAFKDIAAQWVKAGHPAPRLSFVSAGPS